MNVRAAIEDALVAALPDVKVVGYAYEPDVVTKPTIMLWQSRIEPMPQATLDRVFVTVELWALVGTDDPAKADDALDDHLSDVITALHAIPWLTWSTAERGVLLDRFHGYRITAQAVAAIITEES